MSLLQWNIRGFSSHRYDLRQLLSCYEPQVVCLQETFLTSPPIPIPNYNILFSQRSLASSAIFIHHKVPYIFQDVSTPLQCTVAKVHLRRWITIVNLYFSPSQPLDLRALSTLLSTLSPPFLVVGDFNCRHTLWGDSVISSRGRSLESFLPSSDLILLNTGHPTHFDVRTQSFSCLDLSLCSPSLRLDFSWLVLDQTPSSDHFPILLSPTNYVPLPNPPRWRFDRADWGTFTSLSHIPFSPSAFSSTTDLLNVFSVSVLSAALTAIPRTARSHTSKCVPWWNSDCTRALRVKRAAWRSYRFRRHSSDSMPSFISFKRASARLKRIIRLSVTTSWRAYVSTLTSNTPLSAVWRKVHKLSGKHPPLHAPVLKVSNSTIAEPLAVANALGSHFSKISSGSHLTPQFLTLKSIKERTPITFSLSSTAHYNSPFSLSELTSALQSCRNTREGLDHIHYSMLKHLPPSSLTFLLALFNRIWSLGDFPPSWREALVLPFVKPGTTGSLPCEYRPIALTSCLCKLMERMVNHRLMWHLESKSLLSSCQFGYRRARSTADPLAHIDTYIKSAFARRESVLAVFFDLEKAYDTTWRYNILNQLSSLGLHGNMAVFIQSFLSHRSFRVQVSSSVSSSFTQFEGVPQGSVLSTTLFLIAVNGILSSLPLTVRSSLYVDDLAIYSSGSSISCLHALLQSAISSASSWATAHGFRFSPNKSFSIFFTRSHIPPPPPLTLYGTPLRYKSTGKFLGLLFDSRLTWKAHILSLKVTASDRLRLLQTLSHVSWGADRKTLLYLHTTLILSTLDYGCHIYSSASASLLGLLDPIHHLGLRLALGAFRSSPVESLYAESGLPSLSRRRALLSLRCYARLHQFPTTKITIAPALLPIFPSSPRLPTPFPVRMQSLLSHSSFPTLQVTPLYIPSFPPWLIPSPRICPSISFTTPKAATPPTYLRCLFLAHAATHGASTHIYTDGSKTASGSGFAVLFPDRHYQFRMSTEASVLTTELSAILYALQQFLHFPSSSATIFTDSFSSLSLLRSLRPIHPLVLEIQDWLFRLSVRHKSVCFCWVPSHVGIPGNERVDSLARSAPLLGRLNSRSLPVSDYYPAFKTFLYGRWQLFWADLSRNKLHAIKPSVFPWSNPHHKIRRWETALARLRIGHTRLTHSYLMSRSPPDLCPHCQTPFSVQHILLTCPHLSDARRAAFPHLTTLPRAPCLSDVLSESSHFSLDNLMSYLRHINVLHLL